MPSYQEYAILLIWYSFHKSSRTRACCSTFAHMWEHWFVPIASVPHPQSISGTQSMGRDFGADAALLEPGGGEAGRR